ncbi:MULTISPECIES: chromosome segregation protein SMC [unclassified Chelatococcus]|uniref:chromosome segregation protein SMC n=1 Tax=unclassified Chelatococcus TaxID=2638111 RepID=UPI001BCCAD9B|nr:MULTISPECIES: chromosome segregation protein SMC [unclassified Chelatococcus]MBS7695774.1 chromosome segregation protein SMC [Chelatococcus sp. YT9]MBX3555851.1 chromosome segregation protein SMC [Chelatococcus sp.]
MKLTRLKIAGFKSFVEPSEFLIEPGLTGVVGPNGCGKSNLVEALRWVMGESSYKSLRASGMDDVIFAGTNGRPARNSAEVMVVVDNSGRTAPAAFNDSDNLEIARRIERESGSSYRINGREVRARDVQLLFADAATGARSHAMVRQGQIGEIIAAKPQARRRILEDAAGVAGLHTRRHEAELRLKAAEDNLLRLDDVMREIETQVDALRRQGRQAQRYRSLSADIRKLEALILLIAFTEARATVAQSEQALAAEVRLVAERTQAQAEAVKAQAIAAHALPGLRQVEVEAAAALQRLTLARNELDGEERRSRERQTELERRLVEIDRDLAREQASGSDAAMTLLKLRGEQDELSAASGDTDDAKALKAELATAEARLASAERELVAFQAELAEASAKHAAFERSLRDERSRVERAAHERRVIEDQLAELDDGTAGADALEALREGLALAEERSAIAEEGIAEARLAVEMARDREAQVAGPAAELERRAQRLDTEARTLAKLVAAPTDGPWQGVIETITVSKGYEAALAAALGEDLDAPLACSAPSHWADVSAMAAEDPALPDGAVPLADSVDGPSALARRLSQIGVVERRDGARLRPSLKPGQRLVSREGDLWRWDGFTVAAEAPSPAARRLAERNRLAELEAEAAEARLAADEAAEGLHDARESVAEAARREGAAIEAERAARREMDRAREAFTTAERNDAAAAARRLGLVEAQARLCAAEEEGLARIEEIEARLDELDTLPEIKGRLDSSAAIVAAQRGATADVRAKVQSQQREAELRRQRHAAIAAEIDAWTARATRAAEASEELAERRAATETELEQLAEASDTFLLRRRTLLSEIAEAEERRQAAADRLAEAEKALVDADRLAKVALEELATAREARAGTEARLEAARARLTEVMRDVAETLEASPATLHEQAGVAVDSQLPEASTVETRLADLKADRERLGAVNLRAEMELAEAEEKRDSLTGERSDLTEAIRRLRQAIGNLNREGRERLLAAFDIVNGHFQRLFTSLFGGGTAELTLIDSDDPLEAGLEILVRPPGKKPQVMTLLSGGEQALTATALIFAVFLTNPSPVCVLDEVDAPLDDANVERYCQLLRDMARQTETRFIVITHNPITMAQMDRLFGVTMAERGVSQLVSVDLEVAERILEAT